MCFPIFLPKEDFPQFRTSAATMEQQDKGPVPSRSLQWRQRRPRILLGVTGSVAAVKGPELALRLASLNLNATTSTCRREGGGDEESEGEGGPSQSRGGSAVGGPGGGAHVRVLLTRGGRHFWNRASEYDPEHWEEFRGCVDAYENEGDYLTSLTSWDDAGSLDDACSNVRRGSIVVHDPEDEWSSWHRLGDPVLHIDLRNWADVAVVAPLSAHTLAKIASGLCDDPLTCCLRAWDFGHGNSGRPGKPLILAPAMNTAMWDHPATAAQLDVVRSFWNADRGVEENGVRVVDPKVSTLACGEYGSGALADLDRIVDDVRRCLAEG